MGSFGNFFFRQETGPATLRSTSRRIVLRSRWKASGSRIIQEGQVWSEDAGQVCERTGEKDSGLE